MTITFFPPIIFILRALLSLFFLLSIFYDSIVTAYNTSFIFLVYIRGQDLSLGG
jgi:hypothetical protein